MDVGTAFYAESQIWPWVSDSEFVMFALNWSDKPDWVCHRSHPECELEIPHLMSECGRFETHVS